MPGSVDKLLEKMKKRYEPHEIEIKWENRWERNNYFSPHPGKKKATFSMVMPPPNITGALHMGHALNNTLQDIVARFKRMQGYEVLWIPGIDHAGIATQNVVEKNLAQEGVSRQALGREKFLQRVWQWKEKYGERIFSQLRKLGVSCSWDDRSFTMDRSHCQAVEAVFVYLYKEGYIYRGDYIINWCPRCQTALSDIEVEYEEKDGKLYYIRYLFKNKPDAKKTYLIVATTRPETMLGDTAVAANPKDERYKNLEGCKLSLPLLDRELPLVYDEYVDPEFGTGTLKVTPAHDPEDFLIGKRHGLAVINVLNKDGTINENGGSYQSLDRFECRRQIVKDLKSGGYLAKIDDYPYRVGHCYRCRTEIEPYLSPQWFVKMKKLAREAIRAVEEKKIEFTPSFWKKGYFQWLGNIHDWCVSRQIWWGHQLPVWHCQSCGRIMVVKGKPAQCAHCGSSSLKQDPDVLDTWFSSSLWPFSTLGWPAREEKLKRFYPTSLLCTAWDILFFWVSRMVMMGLKFTHEIPFHQVYIHPLIGDEKGEKMSKSRGNVVDPLRMMEKYGTDAFRFSLVAPKTDSPYLRFSENRLRGYRNFANKIWNASRFTLMNLTDFRPEGRIDELKSLELSDKWVLGRFFSLVNEVTQHLDHYRFSEAANSLYQFLWGEFCDWYIELVKPRLLRKKGKASRYTAQWILHYVLEGTLKLLHPFMPFITEDIYQRLPCPDEESIMISNWPVTEKKANSKVEEKMNLLMQVIQEARTLRSEIGIAPQKGINLWLRSSHKEKLNLLRENRSHIVNLVKTEKLIIGEKITKPTGSVSSFMDDIEIFIPLKSLVDPDKERKRLKKNLETIEKELKDLEGKLLSQDFVRKAPPEIVGKEKEKSQSIRSRAEKLKRMLREIQTI